MSGASPLDGAPYVVVGILHEQVREEGSRSHQCQRVEETGCDASDTG
jgi:hypothetical protein